MPNKQLTLVSAATLAKREDVTISYFKADNLFCDLKRAIEFASCINQDIAEGYFGYSESSIETGQKNNWSIILEYGKYSIKTNIVADYLRNLKLLVEEAEDKLLTLRDVSKSQQNQ